MMPGYDDPFIQMKDWMLTQTFRAGKRSIPKRQFRISELLKELRACNKKVNRQGQINQPALKRVHEIERKLANHLLHLHRNIEMAEEVCKGKMINLFARIKMNAMEGSVRAKEIYDELLPGYKAIITANLKDRLN